MQKERNKRRKFLKAVGVSSILFACFCAMIIISTISLQDFVENPINMRQWHRIALGVNDPGGDNGGYTYFMAYPHTADPIGTYDANLSTSNAYEESELINTECANETPHSTTFDFVMGLRVNDTTSYNTSGVTWMPEWIAANITVDFDFAADVAWLNMTLMLITNTADFAWYNCFINNSGAGYQVTNNEAWNATVNVTLWW